jgi:hypothetical protein
MPEYRTLNCIFSFLSQLLPRKCNHGKFQRLQRGQLPHPFQLEDAEQPDKCLSGFSFGYQPHSKPELIQAFQEAALQPLLLRQLFPLASHNMARFSPVTGCPYTMDLPYIEALGNSVYVARHAVSNMFTLGEVIVRGTILEATAAILRVLPQDLAPARNGSTAEYWVAGG